LAAAPGLSGTLHLAWTAGHLTDEAVNVLYDVLEPEELGAAEETRYYFVGGGAAALRVGPAGEAGEVYPGLAWLPPGSPGQATSTAITLRQSLSRACRGTQGRPGLHRPLDG